LLIGLVVLAVLVVGTGITIALNQGGDDKVPASSDTPGPTDNPSGSPTAGQGDEVITASKLYTAGKLPITACAEPKVPPATFTTAKTYYTALLPCMNRTWQAVMQQAGLPFREPKLVVYAGRLDKTDCGVQNGSRTVYCGGNETIYLPYGLGAGSYKRNPLTGRVWMMNTLAHEYGHHVQKLAGIFTASQARAEGWEVDQQNAESRRRELQAACLGSAFLGSAGASLPLRGASLASWQLLVANTGDEFSRPVVRDHGSKLAHKYWSNQGFSTLNPGACNTFTAKTAQTG
jgi:predicted metalloprotease